MFIAGPVLPVHYLFFNPLSISHDPPDLSIRASDSSQIGGLGLKYEPHLIEVPGIDLYGCQGLEPRGLGQGIPGYIGAPSPLDFQDAVCGEYFDCFP